MMSAVIFREVDRWVNLIFIITGTGVISNLMLAREDLKGMIMIMATTLVVRHLGKLLTSTIMERVNILIIRFELQGISKRIRNNFIITCSS